MSSITTPSQKRFGIFAQGTFFKWFLGKISAILRICIMKNSIWKLRVNIIVSVTGPSCKRLPNFVNVAALIHTYLWSSRTLYMWFTPSLRHMWFTPSLGHVWFTPSLVHMWFTPSLGHMWFTPSLGYIWFTPSVGVCDSHLPWVYAIHTFPGYMWFTPSLGHMWLTPSLAYMWFTPSLGVNNSHLPLGICDSHLSLGIYDSYLPLGIYDSHLPWGSGINLRPLVNECVTENYFSYFSINTHVVDTQKNHLNEMVLLSTHIIC